MSTVTRVPMTPLSRAVISACISHADANPADQALSLTDIALEINLRHGRPVKFGAVETMVKFLASVGILIGAEGHHETYYVLAD